jgi:hypothetical protein
VALAESKDIAEQFRRHCVLRIGAEPPCQLRWKHPVEHENSQALAVAQPVQQAESTCAQGHRLRHILKKAHIRALAPAAQIASLSVQWIKTVKFDALPPSFAIAVLCRRLLPESTR